MFWLCTTSFRGFVLHDPPSWAIPLFFKVPLLFLAIIASASLYLHLPSYRLCQWHIHICMEPSRLRTVSSETSRKCSRKRSLDRGSLESINSPRGYSILRGISSTRWSRCFSSSTVMNSIADPVRLVVYIRSEFSIPLDILEVLESRIPNITKTYVLVLPACSANEFVLHGKPFSGTFDSIQPDARQWCTNLWPCGTQLQPISVAIQTSLQN